MFKIKTFSYLATLQWFISLVTLNKGTLWHCQSRGDFYWYRCVRSYTTTIDNTVCTWGHMEASMRFLACNWRWALSCQYAANASFTSWVTRTADRWSLHTSRWLAESTSSMSQRTPPLRGFHRRITAPLFHMFD